MRDALKAMGLLKRTADVDPNVEPPVLLIIDWFMPMIQRVMGASGQLAVDSKLRGFGNVMMDEIKTLKNEYHLAILITQQLNPTAASSSAARAPEWSDAAEWKGFAWQMDNCYGVGNRTEDDIAIMCSSKARMNARQRLIVKLDGAHSRFVDVSNDYQVSQGRMVPKNMETVRGNSSSALAKRVVGKIGGTANAL